MEVDIFSLIGYIKQQKNWLKVTCRNIMLLGNNKMKKMYYLDFINTNARENSLDMYIYQRRHKHAI